MAFLKRAPQASRLLILNGNPGGETLGRAMALAIEAEARKRGADVRLTHLSDMEFDANLAEGYRRRMEWEPALQTFHDDLFWCDRFIVVQPLWWGSAPARLKGLIDRVFLPGVTFEYIEGKALPKPLLKGRRARVVITSDTPTLFLKWFYGNGWVKVLRRQILAFCGFSDLKVAYHAPVRGATPDRLQGYVDQAPSILD